MGVLLLLHPIGGESIFLTAYIFRQQRLKTNFMPTRALPGANFFTQSDGSGIMEKWSCGKKPSGLHEEKYFLQVEVVINHILWGRRWSFPLLKSHSVCSVQVQAVQHKTDMGILELVD